MSGCIYNPSSVRDRNKKITGACWLLPSSRFSERFCLKEIRQRDRAGHSDPSVTFTCGYWYMCTRNSCAQNMLRQVKPHMIKGVVGIKRRMGCVSPLTAFDLLVPQHHGGKQNQVKFWSQVLVHSCGSESRGNAGLCPLLKTVILPVFLVKTQDEMYYSASQCFLC